MNESILNAVVQIIKAVIWCVFALNSLKLIYLFSDSLIIF